MLQNNAKIGGFVRYFDIGQVTIQGRLYFIAWYYEPERLSDFTKESGSD
jgi:hypothetical protein